MPKRQKSPTGKEEHPSLFDYRSVFILKSRSRVWSLASPALQILQERLKSNGKELSVYTHHRKIYLLVQKDTVKEESTKEKVTVAVVSIAIRNFQEHPLESRRDPRGNGTIQEAHKKAFLRPKKNFRQILERAKIWRQIFIYDRGPDWQRTRKISKFTTVRPNVCMAESYKLRQESLSKRLRKLRPYTIEEYRFQLVETVQRKGCT